MRRPHQPARTNVDRLLTLIERTGFKCLEPHARLCAAEVARLEGNETTAAHELHLAHEQFLQTGARGWATRVTTRAGVLAAQRSPRKSPENQIGDAQAPKTG
jgi:hypothetical protein